MIINTQLLTNEMLNDMQEEAGEMGLTGNIYVDARGASPKERDEVRRILLSSPNCHGLASSVKPADHFK